MKFLENAVKKAHGPTHSIIQALKEHLGKPLKARSHKEIHASDLTKEHFCPREVALLDTLILTRKDQHVGTAMRVTFDVGELTAKAFTDKWLRDKVVGDWYCLRCAAMRRFVKYPDPTDSTGGCSTLGHLWEHMEIRFKDEYFQYSGAIDCILDLGAPKLTIVELKIMAPEMFAKLEAPLAEHRIRTNLYMNLVENSKHPNKDKINTKWAKILYISRGYGKKGESGEVLPFKEFDVERNDDDLETPLGKALAVKHFRVTGQIPGGICPFSYSPEAKSCTVNNQCFSGKYPPVKGLDSNGGKY
jgi:hypothetical protein